MQARIEIINLQDKIILSAGLSKQIKKAVGHTLSLEKIKNKINMSICIVDDKKIKLLNNKYLRHNRPTDVIAFNISDKKSSFVICGEIAVSAEAAVSNAKIFKTTRQNELLLYIIHGVLHILGYDDKTARQRKIMDSKSFEILSAVN